MKKKNLLLNVHYALIQGCHWMMIASLVYAVTILREGGFSENQIGIYLALAPLASIVIQPWVASLADKLAGKVPVKWIAGVLLLGSILGNFLWIAGYRNEIVTTIVFFIFGASVYSVSPLYSTMAIQFSQKGSYINFSAGRGMGSLLYAISSVIFGMVIDSFGIKALLYLNVFILSATFFIVISFPGSSEKRAKRPQKVNSVWYILKNYRKYTLFLMASFLLFTGNSMTMAFLIDIVKKLGGGNTELGYCQFVLAVSELPVAFLFFRLQKKIGVEKILQISSVFMLLKMMNIMLAPNLPVLILGHMLQSMGNGAYWASSVYFAEKEIPKEDRVKGQSLMYIASSGLSGAAANFMSGYIVSLFGVETLVTAGVAIAAVGMVIMQYALHEKKQYVVYQS